MKKFRTAMAVGAMVLAAVPVFAANVYTVQPGYSEVTFKVDHFRFSFVEGRFEKFEGRFTCSGGRFIAFDGVVYTDSIKTGLRKRDRDLREIFGAEQFPAMTVKSVKVSQAGSKVSVKANLTIRNIMKEVEFTGELEVFDAGKKSRRATLTLKGEIDRRDFGLRFNKFLEFLVGSRVKIALELEGA